MSRPRKAPDPQRHRPCARCGLAYPVAAIWPEGRICQYCYREAIRTFGTCTGCGHAGVLPGRSPAGGDTCRTCSNIEINVDCVQCGAEAELYRHGRCWRCELTREAELLLTPVALPERPELRAIVTALSGMDRPNSGVTWIRQPHVQSILEGLGQQRIPLNHDALDTLPPSRTVEYIRGLLIEHQALPARDRLITTFQEWASHRPALVQNDSSRVVLDQYLRWHQLRRLEKDAQQHGQARRGVFLTAKQTTTVAIGFLNYLHEQQLELIKLNQHAVDAWYGSGPSTRYLVDDFLYWAQNHNHTPRVSLPSRARNRTQSLGQTERIAIIGKLLQDDGLSLPVRIAGGLVALFAQPVGRTVAMTVDQIRADDAGELEILFAKDWVPVPKPFAILLDQWIDARSNLQTASHSDSKWLFPGTSPGEHLHAGTLTQVLTTAGVPARQTKSAAWRDLVHTVPPALLSRAFGLTPATASAYADLAGSRYSRYANLRAGAAAFSLGQP